MTSLFGRGASAVFIRSASDEGKGEAGGAVSSQTAGCGPRADPEEIPREGRMPRARKHSTDVRCRQKQNLRFCFGRFAPQTFGPVQNRENSRTIGETSLAGKTTGGKR